MTLDYVALAILIAVALILFYGVIVIHDIPYEIAKERRHPHQDAIHYAGWVSLFTSTRCSPLVMDHRRRFVAEPRMGMRHVPRTSNGKRCASASANGSPAAGTGQREVDVL